MTLPAALSPDTLRVTEHGTAMLERACRLRGRAPASRSPKAALAKAPT